MPFGSNMVGRAVHFVQRTSQVELGHVNQLSALKIRCNGMKMLIVAEFVDWVRGQTQFKTNLRLKIVVQDNQERVRIHLLTDVWIYTCFFLYILIASFGYLP